MLENSDKIVDSKLAIKVQSAIPKKRQNLLKWNGWGYKDTKLFVKDGNACISGDRYPLQGTLPGIAKLIKDIMNMDLKDFDNLENFDSLEMPENYPKSFINQNFFEEIIKLNVDHSTEGKDRLTRCHGQNMHDIYNLKSGKFRRIPDIVLWPVSHDEVVKIVESANKFNIVLIPFGGGTSVSGNVTCPQDEDRCIAVLDTSQMNRMLWLDKENLIACFESGILGQDLERILSAEGLTLGHEPDSHEFSSLGGWIATRASGMKKNLYGNIEDLVVQVKMVTTKGVLETKTSAPRISCGPDFNQVILGSEGTLGVITEVVVKIRPIPKVRKHAAIIFKDFESGIKFLREVARKRCQPASIRLMDHDQCSFGEAIKNASGFLEKLFDNFLKFLLANFKGFDYEKYVLATMLFEGDEKEVAEHEKLINEIAESYGGISCGDEVGKRGYLLTYTIAYFRDFIFDLGAVAESFETSVPWDKCAELCRNVKAVIREECKKHQIENFWTNCRVTQTYDAGACVYFYFGFRLDRAGCDSVEIYDEIEGKARDEILASGGSISHHHGVGKIRAKWYKLTVSDVGVNLYKSAKIELDPRNIFACGSFLTPEDKIDFSKVQGKL